MPRLLRWFAAISVGLLTVQCATVAPAEQIQIGVIAPDGLWAKEPGGDAGNAAAFQALVKRLQNITLNVESASDIPEVLNKAKKLILRDKVTLLVLPYFLPISKDIASALHNIEDSRTSGIIALGVLPAMEAAEGLKDFPEMVSFGYLPRVEQGLLHTAALAKFDPIRRTIVIGYPPALDGLVRSLSTGGGNLNLKGQVATPTEIPVQSLVSQNPAAILGVLGEGNIIDFRRQMQEFQPRADTPYLLFAPPRPSTRAYLVAKLIGDAVQFKGARTGRDVVAFISRTPRFNRITHGIELPWTMYSFNFAAVIRSYGEKNRIFGPDESGSDNTTRCCCKDKNDDDSNCTDCDPGKKCKPNNNGSNDCTCDCS